MKSEKPKKASRETSYIHTLGFQGKTKCCGRHRGEVLWLTPAGSKPTFTT